MGRARWWLKTGYDNELSRFRYDVVLDVGRKQDAVTPTQWVSWDGAGQWVAAVRNALVTGDGVGLRGIRDGRVAAAVTAVQRLADASEQATVEDLRRACTDTADDAMTGVQMLADACGVEVVWMDGGAPGVYDVMLHPAWMPGAEVPTASVEWRRYTNTPAQRLNDLELATRVCDGLRRQLPEYMVPAAVMVVERGR